MGMDDKEKYRDYEKNYKKNLKWFSNGHENLGYSLMSLGSGLLEKNCEESNLVGRINVLRIVYRKLGEVIDWVSNRIEKAEELVKQELGGE